MEGLRKRVDATSFSAETLAQLKQLVCVQDDFFNVVSRDRILRSLEFANMHGRFQAVPEAHFKTFRWILADDAPNMAQDIEADANDFEARARAEKSEAKKKLISWLSTGSGIFHLSGKLGSGKSTLMKYLCEHHRTAAELEKWAGKFSLPWSGVTGSNLLTVNNNRIDRRPQISLRKLLLLEARFRPAEITCWSVPIPTSRHVEVVPRIDTTCSQRQMESGSLGSLASTDRVRDHRS